ncbi:MAG TPA: diacylglycerol kinase family protein, partial [bacterium]|nr:diacylglycerol kinase family protein [bacterium]
MTEMVVVHSVVSGKDDPELKKQQISASLEKAASTVPGADPGSISFVSNETELESTITGIIENNVPKVAISGGDGFASLFINVFFKMKAALKKDDYKPDVLFLASGTGNAISYCSKFKNPFTALRAFIANKYKTEPLNMLEVTTRGGTELSHFVSFGADGEIIEIYNAQKRKGLIG